MLAEVDCALRLRIPVVTVLLQGRGYDFDDARLLLSDLARELERPAWPKGRLWQGRARQARLFTWLSLALGCSTLSARATQPLTLRPLHSLFAHLHQTSFSFPASLLG